MKVPFVDLRAQYHNIKREIDEAIARVIEDSSFILGREVERFERDFADYTGTRFAVGVSSGTAALQLALMACGIGPGDEVIVPANSFFATAEAVSTAGATPVFVDVDPISRTISAEEVARAITPRTRAVVPVHLYGQPADLDPILAVARRHGLVVIEDAAQAHGALYRGRRVGTFGTASCFSFYPGKNLGAYGEGGAVLTDEAEIARRVAMLRDHGSARKYHHELIGYNFRMEGMQGAVLGVKLRYLDRWNELRRAHAARYNELLSGTPFSLPVEMPYAYHVYHLYVVETPERDRLQQALHEAGIQTGIHYPVPIHLQPAYRASGRKRLPVAEEQATRVLSLPMFPELTEEQVAAVAQACRQFFAERKGVEASASDVH